MKRVQVFFLFMVLMIFSITAVACGGTSTSSNPPADKPEDADAKVDLSYVTEQIEQYKTLPEFRAPGEPFDAKAVMKGKSILSIPVSSANPFTENIEVGMKKVAEEIGFEFTEWSNQGQPSQWVQGMNHGLNQKYDLIDLLGGTNPSVLQPQVEAATKAGVKVVSTHLSGFEQEIPYVTENLGIDYNKAGRLLADWTILKTDGKPNVLVISSNEVVSTESIVNGIKDEFQQMCPSAKVTYVNVPIPDWSTKIQSEVQSAIIRDPELNYIVPIYDSMSQFVVPAIETTQSADRVKIATFNGTPFVLDFIRQGKVEMDIGENLDWISRAIMDAEMRLIAGLPFVDNENIPLYIWDESNIEKAGNPAQLSTGYGDAYLEGYNKLWGISK
ncbi:sugar ABC transporter substrate-binding protein [Phosphitispora fastidiosa]|uniref:sugar ABC transporter substrate-binding protein n=1 Tax=Phosphitispora fastidiosa TaxID=2837202 RepID=UPI001E2D742E|nr:sugar ABC transporter substrate-binding protein [Phosphitispora fastidiosa]MBU7008648.1 ribose transport system substrate-binding protein [Phosphitispora fastidiosa]